MANPKTTEGEAEFTVPGLSKSCKTYYKIVGDLSSRISPIIILHGGPGASHGYMLPFSDLFTKYSVPVIFYDQLGNGQSTHLRERNGDTEFWTPTLFRNELENLVRHLGLQNGPGYSLLGHSWGGALAADFASYHPKGLQKIIVANAYASLPTWVEGIWQLLDKLPYGVVKTIKECEERGEFESQAYEDAVMVFYKRHLCLAQPWPAPEVQAGLEALQGDSTVYNTMNGPSEITITGNLKDWSIIERLPHIEAPTLVLNGTEDEAQDVTVAPYFWHIPKVKWVTIQGASHFSHVDKRDEVVKLVGEFLVQS